MKEHDWLTCQDPQRMLQFVRNPAHAGIVGQPYISDRKLRMFGLACCRLFLGYDIDDFLDKLEREGITDCGKTRSDLEWATEWAESCRKHKEPADLLLREIIGNPFRPWRYCDGPNRVYPANETPSFFDIRWRTPDVLALAQAAYQELDFDGTLNPFRLTVLADALEEGGCTEEQLLRHLRGEEYVVDDSGGFRICEKCHVGFPMHPEGRHKTVCTKCGERDVLSKARGWIPLRGPHTKGCWATDLILGQE